MGTSARAASSRMCMRGWAAQSETAGTKAEGERKEEGEGEVRVEGLRRESRMSAGPRAGCSGWEEAGEEEVEEAEVVALALVVAVGEGETSAGGISAEGRKASAACRSMRCSSATRHSPPALRTSQCGERAAATAAWRAGEQKAEVSVARWVSWKARRSTFHACTAATTPSSRALRDSAGAVAAACTPGATVAGPGTSASPACSARPPFHSSPPAPPSTSAPSPTPSASLPTPPRLSAPPTTSSSHATARGSSTFGAPWGSPRNNPRNAAGRPAERRMRSVRVWCGAVRRRCSVVSQERGRALRAGEGQRSRRSVSAMKPARVLSTAPLCFMARRRETK
ncbi:unnamed protein product [Closterium sp. NIES-54]